MPRARLGATRHRRKKRILKAASGYRGARHRLYRTAKEAVTRAAVYATRDRKVRKRDFRSLWITRLSGACRQRGMRYSLLISGLRVAGVALNRKMLAEIAVADHVGFDAIVKLANESGATAAS